MTDSKKGNRSPLVKACEHLLQPNGAIIGTQVAKAVLPQFPTFASAIPTSAPHIPAIASIDGRAPIHHARIHDFIQELGPVLHNIGVGRGCRVAVILPNGSELALAILAIAHWATCVPLNANGALSEIEADLQRCRADLVIGPRVANGATDKKNSAMQTFGDLYNVAPSDGSDPFGSFAHIEECAQKLRIPFCGLVRSTTEAGVFRLVPATQSLEISSEGTATKTGGGFLSNFFRGLTNAGKETDEYSSLLAHNTRASSESLTDEEKKSDEGNKDRFAPNKHQDEVLVLFTSGTTGNKKLVPHTLGDMIVATATIALSWDLTSVDVNCNLMPLFHVGGIVRQVFSPVMSGGCVICCPSFDPTIFWALLAKKTFNWYYAAPTMHHMILHVGKEVDDSNKNLIEKFSPKLKMIANAAGGLLPSLAIELRKVFKANVLPSYGMTECMPISSPPSNYQLEKPGTSGVPVGPQVAIMSPGTISTLPPGEEGAICVRGDPCFRGYGFNYLEPDANPSSSFLPEGWFNTGDMGYLDEDGYLYVTGRSKEVINRGGEIISPLEVEQAVSEHPQIQTCIAFSTPHDVLQEVVGMAIVPAANKPRLDLPSLHRYLSDRLMTAKWPQCIVFMDVLPKSHTNKVLRVKLGQRLGLPELSDAMSPAERIFEAKGPKQGTPLDEKIPCMRIHVDPSKVENQLNSILSLRLDQQLYVMPHPTRPGHVVAYVYNMDRLAVIRAAQENLDAYAVPTHVCNMSDFNVNKKALGAPEPKDSVASILQSSNGSSNTPSDPLVAEIQAIVTELLNLDFIPSPGDSFFNLGGGSMLASQLASKLRKKFDVAFGGAEVFHHATCTAMGELIRQRREGSANTASSGKGGQSADTRKVDTQNAPFSDKRLPPENNVWKSIFQLVPITFILPVFSLSRFFFYFMYLISVLRRVPDTQRFFFKLNEFDFDYYVTALILTLFTFHLMWVTITPLLFVVLKWIVIGKYQQGRFALWSNYYLRWWFVDVCRKLIGRGIWGYSPVLLNVYYRLLGAKIGKNARISLDAELAEFDLVNIGENAAVEYATVRPFGVDNGAMILGPISIGNNSSVGIRSVVAPFTSIPDDTHMGPVSSSYELACNSDPKHADYNRYAFTEPSSMSLFLIGHPIVFAINIIANIPPFLILYGMITLPFHYNIAEGTLSDLMEWLCDIRRVPFYIGIRVFRNLVSPFIRMGLAILVKRYIIGKFEAGPRDNSSDWQLLRHWLVHTLFSRQNMQEVTDILGRHYELVSCFYRLLGAKIGKRVFWPGHQPVFTGEFDLLEIGDDVVFGSRSVILCTTMNTCEKIILCAGSNLSDNSVALPGSILGKNAVLGSNSVCPAGWYLPEESVWFGCLGSEPVLLEKGVEGDFDFPPLAANHANKFLQSKGDKSTIRPFGKAFYEKKAPYKVCSLPFIVAYTIVCKILITAVHTIPMLGAIHATAAIIYGFYPSERDYDGIQISRTDFYFTLLWVMVASNLLRVSIWIFVEVIAKWYFVGRRQPGQYNYDVSDYCQRWELYQIIAKIRNIGRINIMEFLAGTPFLVTFFRLAGCEIGENCCLFPAGGDPYMPEPDLVQMGDNCVVDMASIVAHLNTGGHFVLERITMQDNVTLRARSRIQQGVVMEYNSMLLEKSLAMTGEVLDAESVWQGAPASRLFTYDKVLTGQYGTTTSFQQSRSDRLV